MRATIKCMVIALMIGSTGISISAQQILQIPRISEEPALDGNLFETVWDQLEAIPLIMLNPNAGAEASERSEFKMACSDNYFYFAAYNYDSEPALIQSSSKKRDDLELNNDWCGIMLDTYNDHENALDFSTTPAALRLDMQIINDGEGDFPVNVDWNAIWEVETLINDQGWFAEFRIPLSSLRYQVVDDTVLMGVAVFRFIARRSEWDIYPAISNSWGFWSWAKVSQFQHAAINGVNAVNPLYFSPYVLGGYQQDFPLSEDGTEYSRKNVFQRNAGMDIKYGLAKNLTLDLTINTDFAQVEADDQEINLTRFSLFFPEKRQFFMERANVFDFSFGDEGQLFYSRTIGLHDGQQVPLWGGGRVTGRMGDWDLGIMSLQTGFLKENNEKILETTNHTVVRSRRQVPLNKNSYAGFMLTSRINPLGDYNLGFGLDGIFNLKGNTYLKMAVAQTLDSGIDEKYNWIDPSRFQLLLEKRTFEGFSYKLNYERAGRFYDPKMGFEFRTDFTKLGHNVFYGIIPSENSKFSRIHMGLMANYYIRNADNSLETVNMEPAFSATSKNSTDLTVSIPFVFDDVQGGFDLSDEINIQEGQYKNIGIKANYSTSSERMLYADFNIYTGRYYGGWQNSISVNPTLSLGNTWRFSMNYGYYRIDFRESDQVYQTHLVRFKTWYMYSTKLSAFANVQYNTLGDNFFINAKIRYNPREGNDFYLVFNDGINTNRFDVEPNLPFSNQRTILVKYTHTFRMR